MLKFFDVIKIRDAIRDPWIRIIRQSILISSIRIDFGLIRIIRLTYTVIAEELSIAHSNRLTKTNRMVVILSFHDHWMARYLTKRQKSAFTSIKDADF